MIQSASGLVTWVCPHCGAKNSERKLDIGVFSFNDNCSLCEKKVIIHVSKDFNEKDGENDIRRIDN